MKRLILLLGVLIALGACDEGASNKQQAPVWLVRDFQVRMWGLNEHQQVSGRSIRDWSLDFVSKDEATRRKAEEAFVSMGTDAIPWLASFIGVQDRDRLDAAFARVLPDEPDKLATLLLDRRVSIRRAAAHHLVTRANEATLPRILGGLDDGDQVTRDLLLQAIARLGSRAHGVVERIRALATPPPASDSATAVLALACLGPEGLAEAAQKLRIPAVRTGLSLPAIHSQGVSQGLTALLRAPSWHVSTWAVAILLARGKLPDEAITEVVHALDGSVPSKAWYALWLLELRPETLKAVLPKVRALLTHEDPGLRSLAAVVLARATRAPDLVRPLRLALERAGPLDDAKTFIQGLDQLGTVPFEGAPGMQRLVDELIAYGEAALPAIERLAAHPVPATRLVAVKALRKIGDAAIGPLENLAADGDRKVRLEAAQSLGSLGVFHLAAAKMLVADLSWVDPAMNGGRWTSDLKKTRDALVGMGSRVVPLLLAGSQLSDKDWKRILEHLKESARPHLEAGLKSEDRQVRHHATRALEQMPK